MKKIIVILLSAVLLVGALVLPSFAVNKADLLAEAAKSPVYKYVKVAAENAAKSVEITDEQAAQILPIITKAVEVIGKDNGKSVVMPKTAEVRYSEDKVNAVFGYIGEVCGIMGWSYKISAVANPQHQGDIIFSVYDSNGKLIFSYDGDLVADTSAASGNSAVIIAAAGALLLAGAAAIVYSRKRLVVEK